MPKLPQMALIFTAEGNYWHRIIERKKLKQPRDLLLEHYPVLQCRDDLVSPQRLRVMQDR